MIKFLINKLLKNKCSVKTLSLSIDEELVCAGCVDGSIRLFTVIDGQLVTTLANEHPRPSGKFYFYEFYSVRVHS